MILVTGANGMTGRALLGALQRRDVKARAMTSTPASQDNLRAAGAAEVVVASFGDPSSLDAAMRGVDTVFHIPPRMKAAETQNGLNVIAAARRCGVRRIALHCIASSIPRFRRFDFT